MNMLDSPSPFEALAFTYASFGAFAVAVSNLWTWVAVLTAISFWRIRTTSSSDHHHHQQLPRLDLRRTCGPHPQPADNNAVSPSVEPSPALVPAFPSVGEVKETALDRVTEGSKFTRYYYYEEETRERDLERTVVREWGAEDNVNRDGVGLCKESLWEWKEEILRTTSTRARTGDVMGWYRYQDLTMINGNVVRLWDECRRRSSSLPENGCCYSSCSDVWSSAVN